MALVNLKKANWYIERELADWVVEGQSFQLKFEPEGYGSHEKAKHFTVAIPNLCVVCNSDTNLNKHHVVPHAIKKHFPVELKGHNSYDLLPICSYHHSFYETHANIRKMILLAKYGIPNANMLYDPSNSRIRRAQGTLIRHEKGEVTVPPARLAVLQELAAQPLVPGTEFEPFKALVNATMAEGTFLEHIVGWCKHFIEIMEPKFLPESWDIDDISMYQLEELV